MQERNWNSKSYFFFEMRKTLYNNYGVVVNELDSDIVVSEFKLKLRYYFHFQTYTLGKAMKSLSYVLTSTSTILLQGWYRH